MKNMLCISTKSVNLLSAFKNICNLVTGIGTLTILGLFPNQAQAVTATFEGVAPADGDVEINPYTESGFSFEGIGGTENSIISDSALSLNGTDYGLFGNGTQTLEITNSASTPFSLQSFDGGNLSFGEFSIETLELTGSLNGGGSVSATFNATSNVFTTFNLPASFTNLNSVTIESTTSTGTFYDNVVLSTTSASVPFEFSPTLGILAVGSIFGVSRLRKKAAVKLEK